MPTEDPFENMKPMSPEDELLRDWLKSRGEELRKYTDELNLYYKNGEEYPDFMYKSADKYILLILEHYKSHGVTEKPSIKLWSQLAQVIGDLSTLHKKKLTFFDILFIRLDEDVQLIASLNNPEKKKEAWEKLKERGFIG